MWAIFQWKETLFEGTVTILSENTYYDILALFISQGMQLSAHSCEPFPLSVQLGGSESGDRAVTSLEMADDGTKTRCYACTFNYNIYDSVQMAFWWKIIARDRIEQERPTY